MRSIFIFLVACIACSSQCLCQKIKTYNWSWDTDGGILASSVLGYAGTSYVAKQVQTPTFSDLEHLDYNSLPFFDRGAVFNNSVKAAAVSDVFLFGSIGLPVLSMLNRNAKGEKGAITGMMFQTLLINFNVTTAIKASTTRFRPYAYSIEAHEDLSLSSTTRQSFISGHTSTVAATSFFTAKVWSDLNPDSPWKPVVWAAAFMIPATTGYLRYKAGRHFPSDVVMGYGVGALIGYMIPELHRNDLGPRYNLNVLPVAGGLGLNLDVNLNKAEQVEDYIQF